MAASSTPCAGRGRMPREQTPSLDAQVVPVYTDPTDVCITCTVAGIYQSEPSVFVSLVDPKRILVTANTFRAPDYGIGFYS
jgi:hypothetical protein